MLSRIWLAIATTIVATVAPGPESVRVDTNSPMLAMPLMAATM